MYNNLFYSITTDSNTKKCDENEDLDSYKYLTDFFTNYNMDKIEEENKKNNYYDLFYEDLMKIPAEELKKIKKITQKDLDLNQLKLFLQLKNELDELYGQNYFDENEIIRFMIGLKSKFLNLEEIIIGSRPYLLKQMNGERTTISKKSHLMNSLIQGLTRYYIFCVKINIIDR
jgi:hypothetical protein